MAAHGSGYQRGPVCATGAKILYAWAMDAPALTLPEGKKRGDMATNTDSCECIFDKKKIKCYPL